MAYQPKSYRKFIATAATATMVAGAVAPLASFAAMNDATGIYKEAVNYVVDKGIASGVSADSFGVQEKIKRGDAAIMIAKALNLYGNQAKDAGFKDINKRVADAVNPLKEAGIINGKTENEFKPDALITRGEMAIILTRAYSLKVDPSVEVKLTDATGIYKNAVEALVSNKITTGLTTDTFGVGSQLTRGQFAIFVYKTEMLKATPAPDKEAPVITLTGDATVSVDFGATYTDAGATAKDNKDEKVEVKWEITDAAGKVVDKIDTKVPGKYTITYTAKDAAGNEATAVTREVTVKADPTPKVDSVTPINSNQLLVTFNKEVTKESAEKLANYKLNNGNVNLALNDSSWASSPVAKIQEDGKSVVITLDTDNDGIFEGLVNQRDYTLTVDGVKTSADVAVTKAEFKFSYTDTSVPTVENVSVNGNKVLKVKFSEFVKTVEVTNPSNYKIDGVALSSYGVAQLTFDATSNTVTIPLTTALADKDYKLTVSANNSISDASNFKVIETVKDFTIKADTKVAKLTGVEVASDNSYVLVKFDKALDASNFVKGQPLFIDGVNVFNSNNIFTSVSDGNLKLTGDISSLVSAGAHSVNLKSDSNNTLIDAFGIKVDAGSTTYSLTADTVKPTVKSVSVNTGATEVEVKFSEAVTSATAQNRLNYILKDKNGNSVTVKSATFKTGTNDTVVLSVDPLKASEYTLEVKGVKDLSSNTQEDFSTKLNVADTVKPEVTGVTYTNTSIYVTFTEDMNASTIGDISNYLYQDKALPAGSKITVVSPTTVKIDLPTGTLVVAGSKFAVANKVTDLAGNPLAGFGYSGIINTPFTTASLDANSLDDIVAVDTKTVKIKFNKALKSVNAGDFAYTLNNSTYVPFTQQNVSFTNVNGKGLVTFKLPVGAKMRTDVNGVKVKLTSGPLATEAVDGSTLSGTLIPSTGVAVQDGIAPEVAYNQDNPEVVIADTDGNGKVDQIKITFTEALKAGTVSVDDFNVTGLTVADVSYADKVVTLSLNEGSVTDVSDTIGVRIVGDISDSHDNVLFGDTSTTYYPVATAAAATALAAINSEATDETASAQVTEKTFGAAGVTGVTADNLQDVKTAVKEAHGAKGEDLTKAEIQTVVDGVIS